MRNEMQFKECPWSFMLAGLVALFPAIIAAGSTELTRPQAVKVIKKSIDLESDGKCLFTESLKMAAQSFKDLSINECPVKNIVVTGIAKINPNEPLVEFEVWRLFEESALKRMQQNIEKKRQAFQEFYNRYLRNPALFSELERLQAVEVPRAIQSLDEIDNMIQRLIEQPVVVQKGEAKFRLYDDGWRLITSIWVSHQLRKLSESKLQEAIEKDRPSIPKLPRQEDRFKEIFRHRQ